MQEAARLPRRGFSLVELLVVIAIIALLVSILLPGLAAARRSARMHACMSNMKQIGSGYYTYAADSRGWLAAFSWQPGKAYSRWNELNNAGSPTDAHCNQATDIVRRVTDRGTTFEKFEGRMVGRNFGYLVMVDGGHLGGDKLPEAAVACPEDRPTQLWQRAQPDQIEPMVRAGEMPNEHTRQYRQMLPFWSSYQVVPAVWATDFGPPSITQAADWRLYSFSPTLTRFKVRRIDDFAFPSQKVVFFDLFDRHSNKRVLFHALPQAAQPLIFGDASVQVRKTRDSNRGWDPDRYLIPEARTVYYYKPNPAYGDPPAFSTNAAGDRVEGHFRWTRWGVRGVDFGAPEPRKRP